MSVCMNLLPLFQIPMDFALVCGFEQHGTQLWEVFQEEPVDDINTPTYHLHAIPLDANCQSDLSGPVGTGLY